MAVPWTAATAAYLLRRAGFGPTPAEVAAFAGLGLEAAVGRLVDYESVDNTALDAALATLRARLALYRPDPEDFQKFNNLYYEWVFRMVYTERPLEEKLTLFWHGHFATSQSKVGNADLMRLQIETLRRNAVGDFRQTLVEVSADPAMLIWLDNYLSNKAHPNENYARELLELFSLGIGHYSEQDILEIARCFTGWTIRERASAPGGVEAVFVAGIHDDNGKAVLGTAVSAGQGARADGETVCGIVADSPVCPRFLAAKLWGAFGAGDFPEAVLGRMTGAYAAGGRSVREMVRALFLSDEFYAAGGGDAQIKAPYELIAGTMRTLGVPRDLFLNPERFGSMISFVMSQGRAMGQSLLRPPSVKGWDGGRAWINTSTLLARYNFGAAVATKRDVPFINPNALLEGGAGTPEQVVDRVLEILGPLDVGSVARRRLVRYLTLRDDGTPGPFALDAGTVDTKVRGLVKLLLASAEYQMTLLARDPGLPAPSVVSPAFKNGKLVLSGRGANIERGAALRVTGASIEGTEAFPLKASGAKWQVAKRAASAPGGLTIEGLVPAGTTVTLVVENPGGAQSEPVELAR